MAMDGMMKAWVVVLALYLSVCAAPAESKNIICFYTNWAQYRQGAAKYTVSNIDPFLCTHLLYAFAKIENEVNVVGYEWNDPTMWKQFNDLKLVNPDLKTFLAIGGYNHGVASFINMASTSTKRSSFINNIISTLRNNNFDGVDIDWEYPGSAEKAMYATFIQELRSAFENEAASTSKPRLLLSASVPAGIANVQAGFDIPKLDSSLDIWNLMTYDYHGSWENTAGHNSPLNGQAGDQLTVSNTLNYYLTNGASASKLHLGLASYGRTAMLANPSNTAPGSATTGGGAAGPFTNAAGVLAYYEICPLVSSTYTSQLDSTALVKYAFDGNGQWITYEDTSTLKHKLDAVQTNNLAGVMIWTLDFDDFSGTFCNAGTYPLIKYIAETLALTSAPTTQAPTQASTTQAPITQAAVGSSSQPLVPPGPCLMVPVIYLGTQLFA